MEVWSEDNLQDGAEAYLEKIISLKDYGSAVIFYHVAGWRRFWESPILSEEAWERLCTFLYDNWLNVPNSARDLVKYADIQTCECSLVPHEPTGKAIARTNFIGTVAKLANIIFDSFQGEHWAESWIEN